MADYNSKAEAFRARIKVDPKKTDYNSKTQKTTNKNSGGDQRVRERSRAEHNSQNKSKGQSR